MGTWIWLWPLTDILQKGLLRDGDLRMLFLFIFSVEYWFLLLTVGIFSYISYNFEGGPGSQGPGPTFTPCHITSDIECLLLKFNILLEDMFMILVWLVLCYHCESNVVYSFIYSWIAPVILSLFSMSSENIMKYRKY